MNAKIDYQVIFPSWFDEIGEAEAEAKGWLQGVEVVLSDGVRQPLFFYDPIRLAQDLEAEAQAGIPFVASPGLIVIPRITREMILTIIQKLVEERYFPIVTSAACCSLNEIIHTVEAAPAG